MAGRARLYEANVIGTGNQGRALRLMRPTVAVMWSGDVQETLRLHQDAPKKCFIANSVNFPVLLEPAIRRHTG
jgi:organic hydroperoxide reductase OsmC/OhrA